MQTFFFKKKSVIFWGFLFLVSFAVLGYSNFTHTNEQQFVYLAQAFLEHHLYFTHIPVTWADTTFFKGHFYWPLGPLPAILLLPIVYFFSPLHFPYQGIVSFLLTVSNIFLLYHIAKKITGSPKSALWLSWGYVFGSAYLFIALLPLSWFFAQVLGTTLLLCAISEYLYQQRWFLIGMYLALAIAVRDNLILAAVFFFLSLWFLPIPTRKKILFSCYILVPILISVSSLLEYNYLRFGNALENGYATQLIQGYILNNRSYGVWSLVHFPANLYYFFLKGPEGVFLPDTKILTFPYLVSSYFGMSIFLTSPLFLWIRKKSFTSLTGIAAGITVLLMLLFMLGFFSRGGYMQYGYRLSLDFYPFLFLLLAYSIGKKTTLLFRITILISFLTNLYFIYFMFFNVNPTTYDLLQS